MTAEQRDRNVELIVREYRPHNVWEGVDLSHQWAVVSSSVNDDGDELLWLFTVDDPRTVESTGSHDGRRAVALVQLDHGYRVLPSLTWNHPTCIWPVGRSLLNRRTCDEFSPLGAMRWQGGYLCKAHEAEAHDLQREAHP